MSAPALDPALSAALNSALGQSRRPVLNPVIELTPAPPQATALERALERATALIESLEPREIEDLAAGRGRLVFRSDEALGERQDRCEPVPGPRSHRAVRRELARRTLGIDITGVVDRINACSTSVDVAAYLDGLDARFTVPVLREIARAIGPTVNATGRTKGQLQRDIVEGTAGFRERTAAMSGGAWG